MSNPDQPLTRRQLKELRRTGQLPVITEDDADGAVADVVEPAEATSPAESGAAVPEAAGKAEHEPASAAERDAEDSSDAERPLTRKQVRARRLATSQIAVVPDSDDADEPHHVVLPAGFESAPREGEAAPAPADAPVGGAESDSAPESWAARALREAEQDAADDATHERASTAAKADERAGAAKPAAQQAEGESVAAEPQAPAKAADASADGRPQVGSSFGAAVFQQAEERQQAEREQAEREAAERREAKARDTNRAVPAKESTPGPGTNRIAAEAYHLSQETSGSTAGNTSSLILKDMPGAAALSAPITATGELILTSSHSLPDGLGAHGAAKGTTDGKDVDDSLIDGELPEHSSPTPIAASRAVSTSKAPGDVIRPPAPEKNRGMMLALGITAGVLGIALVGVVVYVFATGQLN